MLQLVDASISGLIDLCSAVYHKAMAENNMRVAQDILDIRIVRMLPTTAQQAAIGNYISSFKPQWLYCMYKLQLLAQEALADNHVFGLWVVPWWASLCKTPAAKHVRFTAVQLMSADDQELLLLTYSMCFGVDRCGNFGRCTRSKWRYCWSWNCWCNIAGLNAHASIHDSPLHVFQVFGIMSWWFMSVFCVFSCKIEKLCAHVEMVPATTGMRDSTPKCMP